jgi:putative ABC transport system permease protein
MLSNLRLTLRGLVARPGFTSVVVLTLALPLGACTAVFAVIQAVLLRPLPFTEPDRLFVLGEYSRSADTRFVSPVTFDDWHARQKTFEGLAAFRYWETVNLEDATGEPESIRLATGAKTSSACWASHRWSAGPIAKSRIRAAAAKR